MIQDIGKITVETLHISDLPLLHVLKYSAVVAVVCVGQDLFMCFKKMMNFHFSGSMVMLL